MEMQGSARPQLLSQDSEGVWRPDAPATTPQGQPDDRTCCKVCNVMLFRAPRARLSHCGHMRWTQEGWKLKEERAPKTAPAKLEAIPFQDRLTFAVSFEASIEELSQWKPERMARFFRGIAEAIAAKEDK
jgi:hypothetical protein